MAISQPHCRADSAIMQGKQSGTDVKVKYLRKWRLEEFWQTGAERPVRNLNWNGGTQVVTARRRTTCSRRLIA
jgi:hypothetical protein